MDKDRIIDDLREKWQSLDPEQSKWCLFVCLFVCFCVVGCCLCWLFVVFALWRPVCCFSVILFCCVSGGFPTRAAAERAVWLEESKENTESNMPAELPPHLERKVSRVAPVSEGGVDFWKWANEHVKDELEREPGDGSFDLDQHVDNVRAHLPTVC